MKNAPMLSQTARTGWLAAALSALAGYVDSVGFLSLGLFVSFMSGNSTLLGIAATNQIKSALIAFGLITIFVLIKYVPKWNTCCFRSRHTDCLDRD
jgi:uncharacterized membrane protein YoaK (UPF0700 family)